MNAKKMNVSLPAAALLLGVAGFFLRRALYAAALDGTGLLVPGHGLEWALWALTAAAAVLTALAVKRAGAGKRWEDSLAPGIPAAAGCLVLAVCLTAAAFAGGEEGGIAALDRFRSLLAPVAAAALVYMGICCFRGRKPFFLWPAAVSVYFALHTLSQYRYWSSQPQLQSYFFPMAGMVALLLFAYYLTALAVGLGSRRILAGAGMAGTFACLTAAARTRFPLVYLAGGIWLALWLTAAERREER